MKYIHLTMITAAASALTGTFMLYPYNVWYSSVWSIATLFGLLMVRKQELK